MLKFVVWMLYIGMAYISILLLLVLFESDSFRKDLDYPEEWPSITVAIPAYNEEDTIEMTVESALSVEYPEDKYNVTVINDGSEDATLEKVKKYEEEGKITLLDQENQGKGAAINNALEETDTDLFAVVDADSYLKDKSVKNIVAELEDDMAGIASAMKVYKPENFLQKTQRVEYIVSIFLRKLLGIVDAIQVAPGPLSVYRADVLEDLGGFDPESRVEDQEICYRVNEEKMRIGHSRAGGVYTVAPPTLKDFYNQRYRWQRGSLETILDYRHMILNSRYGEFGFMGIPLKLLQIGLSTLGFFVLFYIVARPIYQFVQEFMQVGMSMFNVSFELSQLPSILYWNALSIQAVSITMLVGLGAISFLTAILAGRHTREDLFKYGYIPAVIYLFFYFYIITPIWLKVFFDMIVGREKGW